MLKHIGQYINGQHVGGQSSRQKTVNGIAPSTSSSPEYLMNRSNVALMWDEGRWTRISDFVRCTGNAAFSA
jgi:hypothetical protein